MDAVRHLEAGDAAGAARLFRAVLAREPRHADALHMLGVSCHLSGHHDDAVDHIHAALHIRRSAAFLADLALALGALGRDPEAVTAYRDAIGMGLRQARLHNNLGNLLNRMRDRQGAIEQYRLAIDVDARYALAHKNLAIVYAEAGAHADALAAFEHALQLDGDLTDAWLGYGSLLERLHRLPEAERAYRRARRWESVRHVRRQLARWDDLAALDSAVAAALAEPRAPAMTPWVLLNLPGVSATGQRDAARRFAASRWAKELTAAPLVSRGSARAGGGRLRIGYLSADFKDHATMHLLAGVLERHDPARVDVHLYSYGPAGDDAYRARIARMPAEFHEIRSLSDADAADRIARDAIQILVDLKGYTTGARPGIPARRPAPVIVSWLGYPGSLGEPRLADYLIGDAVVTPIDAGAAYSETLALMPDCYQPNDVLERDTATPSRGDAGLPEHGFVFCSFNQTFKFDPDMFAVWCELLNTVPGSVLWLARPDDAEAQTRLRDAAQAHGVDPSRVIFAARLARDAHLARLRLADLALDTYPVGSHTTASDALRAGVPMVTRIGETFASRVGASLLRSVGLGELVTDNLHAYRDVARALAANPARFASVRATLDERRHHGPLFDPARFAHQLERLYRAIWARETCGTETDGRPIVLDASMV